MVTVHKTCFITSFAIYLLVFDEETCHHFLCQLIHMNLSIYSYEILEGVYMGVPSIVDGEMCCQFLYDMFEGVYMGVPHQFLFQVGVYYLKLYLFQLHTARVNFFHSYLDVGTINASQHFHTMRISAAMNILPPA